MCLQNYVPPHVTLTRRKDKILQAAVKGFLSLTDQGLLQSGHTRVPKRHACHLCPATFAIARVLEAHQMLEHGVSAGWRCGECGMQFLQGLSCRLHTARSHKPYPCQTDGCSASFGTRADLMVHTLTHRDAERVAGADDDEEEGEAEAEGEGGAPTTTKKRKKREKPVFKCHLCPAEYPHMCKLRYHMRKHTGERPFRCSECSSSFQTSSQRLGHIRRTHVRARKHLCDLCGKKFKDPRTLREHSWTHSGEKPYSCPVCSRGFSKRDAMSVHLRQHTGEKPYVCDQCGQSFTVRVSLRTHLKSKHNITVDTSMYRRQEDDPGDNSIPLIGRPKRKDVEKRLSLSARRRVGQQENGPTLEPSQSGRSASNAVTASDALGTSLPSFSDGGSERVRIDDASFAGIVSTAVQPEPKAEQALLPDVRTVALSQVALYEANLLPGYSPMFHVVGGADGHRDRAVGGGATLSQQDSHPFVESVSSVYPTPASLTSALYNGYLVKPPKY